MHGSAIKHPSHQEELLTSIIDVTLYFYSSGTIWKVSGNVIFDILEIVFKGSRVSVDLITAATHSRPCFRGELVNNRWVKQWTHPSARGHGEVVSDGLIFMGNSIFCKERPRPLLIKGPFPPFEMPASPHRAFTSHHKSLRELFLHFHWIIQHHCFFVCASTYPSTVSPSVLRT